MRCARCGAPATVRFTVDMDIEGIGACGEHDEEVRTVVGLLVHSPDDGEFAIGTLAKWRKQWKE